MPTPTRFKKHPLTIAIQACCYTMLSGSPLALATPTGGTVVGGTGTISQSGNTTTINQATQNLAINWQTFDVVANERVQFIQPNADAVALNRILSNNGSIIAGRIDANGRVILVNANGIFFTSTAVLNVGSIIASGLDINPNDFMNNQYVFNEIAGTSGAVVNSGLINASLGGNVALIGKQVKNDGLIVANLGTVSLAAGKQAVLTFDNGGLLGVRVTQEVLQSELGVDPAVLNGGEIQAQGGRVLLTASQSQDVFSRAVNTSGLEPATSVVMNEDGSFTLGNGADVVNSGTIDVSTTSADQAAGRIVLIGENVTSSGTLRADAQSGNGGEIELHARDTTLLTLNSLTSARSESNGNGGIVKVLGDKVGLFDQSTIDVSGANGGGQALIGGDFQGSNSRIRNASRTYVSGGSSIYADAIQQGNGGKIINWGNDYTWFYGSAFARGGSVSGDGGLVEISGKGLSFDGGVDTSAKNGLVGTLLFDPTDIIIHNGGGQPQDSNLPQILAGTGAGSTFNISEDALEGIGSTTNILLQATNDIIIQDVGALELDTGSGNSVTFTANSDSIGGGDFTMQEVTNAIFTQGGSVFISGDNVTVGNVNTTTNGGIGGNITIAATNGDIEVEQLTTRRATGATSGGDISLTATGGDIILNNAVATNNGNFSATTITSGYFNNSGSDDSSITTGTGSVTISTVGSSGGVGANLGRINAGSLNVTTSGGRIRQSTTDADRYLAITGTASFNANSFAIDLSNTANNMQGAISLTTAGAGNNATLQNRAETTILGAVTTGGTLAVTADRHLTLTGAVTTTGTTLNFGVNSGATTAVSSTFTTDAGILLSAGTGSIVVNGSTSGENIFVLNSLFTGTVNGGTGTDTLEGPDPTLTFTGSDWQLTASNSSTGTTGTLTQGSTLTFNGMDNLRGGSGADTFTIADGVSLRGYIDGGDASSSAIDLVNISARTSDTTVQLLTTAPTGSINNATGTYTLYQVNSVTANTDAGINNSLVLLGGTASSVNAWDISGSNSGSVNYSGGSTAFSGFKNLTGNAGQDTFTFSTSSSHIVGLINGGGGADDALDITAMGDTTVNVLPSAVASVVTTNSFGTLSVVGIESINANTGAANTITSQSTSTNSWSLTSANGGTLNTNIEFSGFSTVNGGNGDDTFVIAAGSDFSGTINGRDGSDGLTINMSGAESGTVNYNGGTGANDTVTIQGTTGSYDGTYVANAGALTGGTFYDQLAYTSGSNTYVMNLGGVNAVNDSLNANSLVVSAGATTAITLTNNTLDANNAQALLNLDNKASLVLDGIGTVNLDGVTLTDSILTLRGVNTLINLTSPPSDPAITARGLVLDDVALTVNLNTDIDSLSVINSSGPVTIVDQGALSLGSIITSNALDITASGTVNSTAALVSSASFSVRSTGDIDLMNGFSNALSGAITLQQIDSLSNPIPDSTPNNTISLNNVGTTTLAAINAGTFNLSSTGNISDSLAIDGAINVANNIILSTPGSITLTHMDRIASGNFSANSVNVETVNGIGSLTTTTATLDIVNRTGNVNVSNTGNVSARVITDGNITFANNGTVTIRKLSANGGNENWTDPNFDFGGTINLTVTNGSVRGTNYSSLTSVPDIVADTFIGNVADGDFGQGNQPTQPMSVLVGTYFELLARGAYIRFIGSPPYPTTPPVINADVSLSFDSTGYNPSLLEIDSLGELDPAIFTEIRNYYYEDVAILLPADQRLDGSDDEEEKNEKEEKL